MTYSTLVGILADFKTIRPCQIFWSAMQLGCTVCPGVILQQKVAVAAALCLSMSLHKDVAENVVVPWFIISVVIPLKLVFCCGQ